MMRDPRHPVLMKAGLFLGSTMVSLLLIEVGLRIIAPPSPFSPWLPLRPHHKMVLHVKLKGVSPIAVQSTNRWGLRGDEPPSPWDQYLTIVTIGGSTTQCYYLDDHKTWPYLLQERLKEIAPKVWVGNGGLDGQSTRAHLLFMRTVIPSIKPKIVIFLVGANDLGFSISEDVKLHGNPYDQVSWKSKLYGSSRLVQILYTWKLIVFNRVTVVKQQGHGDYVPKPFAGDPASLPRDLATLLPSLPEYRENLQQLIHLGRAMHIRMIFLTQPMLYDDTEYWRHIEGTFYWIQHTKAKLSAATYWRLLDYFNKALLDTCQREGVECVDLASPFPHDSAYFYDVMHFTERGAALVAEKVAEHLKATAGASASGHGTRSQSP